MTKEEYLKAWLAKTLVDNPDLITMGQTPVGIYAELQAIWLKEVQIAFIDIIKEYWKPIINPLK